MTGIAIALLHMACRPAPALPLLQENERLRSEVGELKTAKFSAEAMAARLEEMNTLSIRVGGWMGWGGCVEWESRLPDKRNRFAACRCSPACLCSCPYHWPTTSHSSSPLLTTSHCLRSPCLPALPASAGLQVASLKIELAALRSEQDVREDQLLAQISLLQVQLAKKKKKRSPGKMLKKTFSQVGGFDSCMGARSWVFGCLLTA
jgi:hypothetical protein